MAYEEFMKLDAEKHDRLIKALLGCPFNRS
jgi:hypothetical protein